MSADHLHNIAMIRNIQLHPVERDVIADDYKELLVERDALAERLAKMHPQVGDVVWVRSVFKKEWVCGEVWLIEQANHGSWAVTALGCNGKHWRLSNSLEGTSWRRTDPALDKGAE